MQGVRFTETADGVSLAWLRTGKGPPLVKVAGWLTHLEDDRTGPIWAHHTEFLEGHFDYLRYDERGCGMSDRDTGALNLDTWVDDLRRVVEVSGIPRPFTLLAHSQAGGSALAYAARYPEDVSQIVLNGAYARGVDHRSDPKSAELYHAMVNIFRLGFDDENPAFRKTFTTRFFEEGDDESAAKFAEQCLNTTTPEAGARLLTARAAVDASDYLPKVAAPTLIVQSERDRVVPMSEARFIAGRVPGAELITLKTGGHILAAKDPSWKIFKDLILERAGIERAPGAVLTDRETAILDLLSEAKSNKEIARALDVSDKTVRNHLTNIFNKLGVKSRAEAVLKAGKS